MKKISLFFLTLALSMIAHAADWRPFAEAYPDPDGHGFYKLEVDCYQGKMWPTSECRATVIGCDKDYRGEVRVPTKLEVTFLPSTKGDFWVRRIENRAFAGAKMADLHISSKPTEMGVNVCAKCLYLRTATFFESPIKRIPESSFDSCVNLKKVVLPIKTQIIEANAFRNCRKLEECVLPNTLLTIESQAFMNCASWKNVVLGSKVSSIEEDAFFGCTGIEEFTVSADNKYFCSEDGVLYNKDKTILLLYPAGNARSEFVIPNTVTTIASYAFDRANKLNKVTVPASVKTIEQSAFYNCENLAVMRVESPALVSTDNNVSMRTYFGSKIKRYEMGDNITTIKKNAFEGCSFLETVDLNKVTTLGSYAFKDCVHLNSITLPKGMKAFNDHQFEGCAIKEWNIETNALELYLAGADIKAIEKVTFGGDVQMAQKVFKGAPNLKEVEFNDNVSEIAGDAFNGCAKLASIRWGSDKITSIIGGTFEGCTALTVLNLPNSLRFLSKNAFFGCTGLKKIFVGAALEEGLESAFEGCTKLEEYYVVSDNAHYKSVGGMLYSQANELLRCPAAHSMSTWNIPASVTGIAAVAFKGCKNLRVINASYLAPLNVIPNGPLSFADITPAVTIYVKETYLSQYKSQWGENNCAYVATDPTYYSYNNIRYFLDHENLTATVVTSMTSYTGAITLPSTISYNSKVYAVRAIADEAFKSSAITSISMPNIREIGVSAFENCEQLKKVNTSASGVCFETPANLTAIGENAFKGCTALNGTVYLSGVLKRLEDGVFSGCTGVTKVQIGAELENIADNAFRGCFAISLFEVTSDANPSFSGIGGILYSKDETTLIKFPPAKEFTNYRFLDNLVSARAAAFDDCTNLTSLEARSFTPISIEGGAFTLAGITNTITVKVPAASINDYKAAWGEHLLTYTAGTEAIWCENGLYYLINLSNKTAKVIPTLANEYEGRVHVPATIQVMGDSYSVKEIYNSAFENCSGLKAVYLAEGLTTIGFRAFYGCSKLAELVIPSTVTSLGNSMLEGTALKYISSYGSKAPAADTYTFDGVNKSIPVYVPAGKAATYKAATGWKAFTNIREMSADVENFDLVDLSNNTLKPGRYIIVFDDNYAHGLFDGNKDLVSLGSAVQVENGRVQLPSNDTCIVTINECGTDSFSIRLSTGKYLALFTKNSVNVSDNPVPFAIKDAGIEGNKVAISRALGTTDYTLQYSQNGGEFFRMYTTPQGSLFSMPRLFRLNDAVEQLFLTIELNDEDGGTVYINGMQKDNAFVTAGTTVTIKAEAYEDYVFKHWVIGGKTITAVQYDLTVNSDMNMVAVFESNSTGIESIQPAAAGRQKLIRNGQLLIEKDGNIYTVTGQKVR